MNYFLNTFLLGFTFLFIQNSAFTSDTFIIDSQYTEITKDKCVTETSDSLNENPEIEYYTGDCPAFGGYKVQVSGGDLRYALELSYEGNDIILPQLLSFHDVGSDKIEWRYQRNQNNAGHRTLKFIALIYRLNKDKLDPTTGKTSPETALYVVRLNGKKSCYLGKIPSHADMNEQARKLADESSAPCVVLP